MENYSRVIDFEGDSGETKITWQDHIKPAQEKFTRTMGKLKTRSMRLIDILNTLVQINRDQVKHPSNVTTLPTNV